MIDIDSLEGNVEVDFKSIEKENVYVKVNISTIIENNLEEILVEVLKVEDLKNIINVFFFEKEVLNIIYFHVLVKDLEDVKVIFYVKNVVVEKINLVNV